MSYNFEANRIDVEETLYKEMKSPEWKKLEINEMTTVIKFSITEKHQELTKFIISC